MAAASEAAPEEEGAVPAEEATAAPAEPTTAKDGPICVPALALKLQDDLSGTWAECRVVAYDNKSELFKVKWVGTGDCSHLSRLNVCFLTGE